VPLQEREQQFESLVRIADNIALFKRVDSAVFLILIDIDVEGARTE
jgi:hypothetical protein